MRGGPGLVGAHALGLVDEGEFFLLDLGHELHFDPFHLDLVGVDLGLALGGEVPAGAHREGIGHHAREAGDDHIMRLGPGADDRRDEAEVGGEAVVEPVHDAPEVAAGGAGVPGFRASADDTGEFSGVIGAFGGDGRGGLAGAGLTGPLGQSEVCLNLASFLGQNPGQHGLGPELAGDPGQQFGLAGDLLVGDGAVVFLEEALPLLNVLVFDLRQPFEEVFPLRVGLHVGQLAVEVRRVNLVREVVVPVGLVDRGGAHGKGGPWGTQEGRGTVPRPVG